MLNSLTSRAPHLFQALQADKATFYDDKDADGISKPPGWLFLSEDARL